MEIPPDFFQNPAHLQMRQYEALRAFLQEGCSRKEAAQRGGYTYKSFCNLLARFRKNPTPEFFWPKTSKADKPARPDDVRPQRILTLRKQHNMSIYQIQKMLAQEGISVSIGYIQNVFTKQGIRRISRRSPEQRSIRAIRGVRADRRALDLSPQTFRTDFAGLFLFAFDLARMNLEALGDQVGMHGTSRIPAGCAVRSLLALKLWGIGRPAQVMAEVMDQGLALFAGLNAIPKRSMLSAYSAQVDPMFAKPLMDRFYQQAVALGPAMGQGRSFDLDFHTIPYHGDEALLQKHYVSKRSRRQRGILTVLARDVDARIFAYADTTVRKETQKDAVLRFVDYWTQRTGRPPMELVFDSGFTTHEKLAVLNDRNINFITLRRRHARLMEHIRAIPSDQWRKITLTQLIRVMVLMFGARP